MHPRPLHLFWIVSACGLAGLHAAQLNVAAATDLTYAVTALDEAYQKANPGDKIITTIADSDHLFTQIKAGAPIDVFLASDVDYPQKLVDAGAAQASSLTTYATGRLALYTLNHDIDVSDVATALADPRVKHIAISNPLTTPSGLAAKQSLLELEIWPQTKPKLLVGDTLAETEKAVVTGRADVGFVALPLLLTPDHAHPGFFHEVPSELYDPLDQAAVITTRGAANPAARRYLDFLKSRPARELLERFGFARPAFE